MALENFQSHPRKTVLILEDDHDLRRIFSHALRLAGFSVVEADDGVRALQIIQTDPPDLMVLDIDLPTLDGLSVRDELAAQTRTRDIPVVVTTGLPYDFGWRLRDDRVLRKPISPEQLVATIQECLAAA